MQNHCKQAKVHGRSSTPEILGGCNAPSAKRPNRWLAHYTVLSEYRERLLNNLNAQSREARLEISTSGEHMADAGTDSYDRDWTLAMASSTQSMLYEIEEALNRIKNGSYGRCELTGELIEAERLKAIPWTRFSAEAQSELEHRGARSRVHLGELGSYAQVESDAARDSEAPDYPENEVRKAA